MERLALCWLLSHAVPLAGQGLQSVLEAAQGIDQVVVFEDGLVR